MNVFTATDRYEAWLAGHVALIADDLAVKHRQMAEESFAFLRATLYRWAQRWPRRCADLADAPVVLAVGDLHIDNFGTWRDAHGRLIWGVNDLDEASRLPYTADLVRLAASAVVADEAHQIAISLADACGAVLDGYREGLADGGRPFVLEERHRRLRAMALDQARSPERYWARADEWTPAREPLPAGVVALLEGLLPAPGLDYRVVHRIGGLGSLGRPRYTALVDWRGGRLACEAKALAPSAWRWERADDRDGEILYGTLLERSVRCVDPLARVHGAWVARRLPPDCSRIDLETLSSRRDEAHLLRAMAWETANMHLGSPEATTAVLRDLRRRPADWLRRAVGVMVDDTLDDWRAWRRG